jgi:hypothetical protein
MLLAAGLILLGRQQLDRHLRPGQLPAAGQPGPT